MMIKFTTTCFLTFLLFSSQAQEQPKHEFRGIWIASVANIDWPRSRGLDEATQKAQYIEILDFYQNLNFNAVVVQIRAAGDAFYPSDLAPWSRFLTGKEGEVQDSLYDPLEWLVEEAHARGFEFHAWLNPYRATTDLDTTVLSPEHAFYKNPEWMLKYGTKYYFNPGLPEVKSHVIEVIQEVVKNYDIDAVHFDDYFYPYKITGEIFHDSVEYNLYSVEGQSIDDWRRSNVDDLVRGSAEMIRSEKPWVQFGVSPFGVWRNAAVDSTGSPSRAGQTTYDDLYADPLKWMREKWIDYNVPQLYWSMEFPAASHRLLVEWWAKQAGTSHIYIGHGFYKVKNNADKAWNKIREIPNQIELNRDMEEISGSVYFSAKSIMGKHKRLSRQILRKYYEYPALPPSSPFAGETIDEIQHSPEITEIDGRYNIILKDQLPESVRYVIAYGSKKRNEAISIDNPSMILSKTYVKHNGTIMICVPLKGLKKGKEIAITFLDRFGNESRPYYYIIQKKKDIINIQPKLM